MEKVKEVFKNYVSNFDMSDIGISRKYYHSIRVMDYAIMLGKDNNINTKDIKTVTLAGLLHDYGRFYQWTKYHTYNDLKSIDHADYAVWCLFEKNEIENFDIDKGYYDILYKAIKYHNKLYIPDGLTKKEKIICNIIRDADKLDILYLVGMDKSLMKEDNEQISDIVKNTFFKHKTINRCDVKNNNEEIIVKWALIYDINFKSSFEIIKERKYLDTMYDLLDDKDRFKEYYEECIKYLNNKLEID